MESVTVLDGGLGGEILRRLGAPETGLWAARALIERPEVITEVHDDFIRAGARMITTNSYSTVPSYLGKEGLAEHYKALTAQAGQIARSCADKSRETVIVAGAVPPLGESYRPDLVPPADVAAPILEGMVEALTPHVDCFLCETMSSIAESVQTAKVALESGKPVFVSWTLNEAPGAGLRSGESVLAALAALEPLPLAGYLLNCTHPDAIEAALKELSPQTSRPLGAYPNRFDVPAGWTLDNDIDVVVRPSGTDYFVERSKACIEAGATIIGGCCGVGPADIAALSAAVSSPRPSC